MARPARIELPDTLYYVSNSVISRLPLFRDTSDTSAFLRLLADSHHRFGATVHGYALTDNAYHLLVHTREANLHRIMRHVNGVYTQHHQRVHNRSGSVFRQRYRAWVIEGASLGPDLIHRLHFVGGTSGTLASSRECFDAARPCPEWLSNALWQQVKPRQKRERMMATPPESSIEVFLESHREGTIVGSAEFRRAVRKALASGRSRPLQSRPGLRRILRDTAAFYGVPARDLMVSTRGRGVESPARSVAMYLCQTAGGMTLAAIADAFELASYASAGSTVRNVRRRMADDPAFSRDVLRLHQSLMQA